MKAEVTDESRPLMSHLKELRQRLIIGAAFLVAGIIFSFIFLCDPAIQLISQPLYSRNVTVIYTGVSDAFVIRIRMSMILGAIITSPVIIFLIWGFVKPALYETEIRRFRILFALCFLLFLLGTAFCYLAVYSLAVDFFLVAGEGVAQPLFAIDRYISFLVSFILPFGIAFELPVVIYMLARHGVVDYRQLRALRKYVILIIVTVSAILTPPDVVSQLMLSLPVFLLYEIGVLTARLCKTGQSSAYSK